MASTNRVPIFSNRSREHPPQRLTSVSSSASRSDLIAPAWVDVGDLTEKDGGPAGFNRLPVNKERARPQCPHSLLNQRKPPRSVMPVARNQPDPARSRRTISRKPSCLISWPQPAPLGGRSVGEGRQGLINADTRISAS